MKLRKNAKIASTALLLSIALCLFYSSASLASTIYFEAEGLPGIGGYQFDILAAPDGGEFEPDLAEGWTDDFSPPNSTTVAIFDVTSNSDLTTGVVGTFKNTVDGVEVDVELGNWLLFDQDSKGVDFTVLYSDGDYTIKAVPLPSALILLGSGLAGMVGIRRRQLRN